MTSFLAITAFVRSPRFSTLSWVHAELAPHYSAIGRPSIDPVLMIRMLILDYVFAIRSERAICREVQVNLAYRWFCGLSIEDRIPDHSTFTRARNERFRDSDIFRRVFERVVEACIAAGLVGAEGFAVDASLIVADANEQRSIPGREWSKEREPGDASHSYLDGKIFSQTAPRHTHRQWLAFLRPLDAEAPGDLTLHLIIDNYATHKHPTVKRWIDGRNARQRRDHSCERIVLHFTPTSNSWMNLVERFFRDLTEDAVREGSFTSVPDLVRAIETYLAERNKAPNRYVWMAQGRDILVKINRARATLGQAQYIV